MNKIVYTMSDVLSMAGSFQLFLPIRLHRSPSGPFCWKHGLRHEVPAFRAGFTPFPSLAGSGASRLPHPADLINLQAKACPSHLSGF